MKSKISVIISTYNGEKYVYEQLLSIYNQTLKPDKVIIIDDNSADKTKQIIINFIEQRKLLNYFLYTNRVNEGWRNNFHKAMLLSDSKYTFFSDQDDIWENTKIEKMINAMENNSNILVLACNLKPIYELGSVKIAKYYTKNIGIRKIQRVDINKYGLLLLRPGCSICFKEEILLKVEKIWNSNFNHDSLVWDIGILNNATYIINEKLIYWRRHNGDSSPKNRINLNRIKDAEHEKEKIEIYTNNINNLTVDKANKEYLSELAKFTKARTNSLYEKSVFDLLIMLKYINYYYPIKMWFGDLIYVIKEKINNR